MKNYYIPIQNRFRFVSNALFILCFVFFAGITAKAQNVVVVGADATTTANSPFATLGAAFASINAAAQSGAITITILGDTTEPATASLTAGTWTTLSVSPSGGPRIITGAIIGHLIDLDGADNVTIDGLNTGSNSLTISNTGLGAATAIRFVNDATNNTIQNCTIQGSGSASFGVVYFGGGTVTGNDNNNVNNCNITGAGANLPLNGIYSFGTSTAIDNSGNTINANNISDYYNASNATNGIQLASTGNSGWTITNNRLFQTATRLYTSAGTHNGINIQAGSGYTITGNFIGYANSSGTGTTNIVGNSIDLTGFPGSYTVSGTANATRYVAINCAFTVGGTVSSIQNNTIAGFALYTSSGASTTSGIWCGLAVTSGSANIGTTSGNTIGATTGTGSIYTVCTTSGGIAVGMYVASVNSITIQNNTIGAIDAMGSTASICGGINGINVDGISNFNVFNNTIGNSTNPNLRMGNLNTGANLSNIGTTFGVATGLAQFNGIIVSSGSANTIGSVALPNIIRNASLNSSSSATSTSIRGIVSTGSIGTIRGNQINNLTTRSLNVGVANTLLAGMGIFVNSTGSGTVIDKNVIHTLSLTNTAASGTNLAGIAIFAGPSTTSNNLIYNLSNESTSTSTTAPGTASGIFMRQPAVGVHTIVNNMISLGNGQTANTAFNGIWQQNSFVAYTLNSYFNTINIEGTVAAGAQPSFCHNVGSYTTTTVNIAVDIRNNIMTNSRTGGTGKHYAIGNDYGATANAIGWGANASNYNLLNSANPATIGFWTTDQTFDNWKTVSASDTSSITAIPITFVSSTDLHLNMGLTPTFIESRGTPIAGITTDFDNQNRPGPSGSVNGGASAPDLGADEFDGVYIDISPPTISYTPLSFTCSTSIRTLVATITDASGVPTTGVGLPVLYWKINAGAYTGVTATSLGSNQYQFVFGAGVVVSDIVSYYIVAQDNLGFIGAFPSTGATGFTTNPPAASTPPSSPSSYFISTVLASGTYTVGAAGTYPTLTAAINDYNTKCLSGAIVFELLDATYAEAGPMTIIKHPDGSATNTLTIRPASGVTASVSATVASAAVIKILGNYVTIDGSNNGSTSRNLTISNLSGTSPYVVHIGSTGTSPINNVMLKNNIIINGASTASAVVTSDGTFIGTAGYFNTITITNNDVQKAIIGIFNVSTPGNGSGLTITNNSLNTSGANSIRRVGIYVQGIDGVTVSGNTVGNFDATTNENDYGIWLASGTKNATVSNNTISNLGMTSVTTGFAPTGIRITSETSGANNIAVTGNTISGLSSSSGAAGISTTGISAGFGTGDVTISNNTISNIKNTSSVGWGANGILLSSTLTTANFNVNNNFVNDVAGFGFAASSADDNGSGIAVTSGAGYNIYYNTVNLTTNQTAAGGLPAAFLVTTGVTAANAINLRNNIFANNQTGGSTQRYSIYSAAPNTVFSAIDFNDYFTTTGPNLGFIGSTNRPDLAAIQAGFGGNLNSLNIAPVFVNPASDLHLVPASNSGLNGFGTPIAGITADFDNDLRSATAPDMGADEFGNSSVVNLKLFIEGYYLGGGLMTTVQNNQDFPDYLLPANTNVENITVELRDAVTTALVASTNTMLKTDGTAVCTFPTAPSGSFYLAVKTRTTVQTWSKLPQTVGALPLSYDFTTSASLAYDDNQAPLAGGVFGFFSGDIDSNGAQDGEINASDYSEWEADSNNLLFGSYATDLNGDGEVNATDYSIWESNANGFVFALYPSAP